MFPQVTVSIQNNGIIWKIYSRSGTFNITTSESSGLNKFFPNEPLSVDGKFRSAKIKHSDFLHPVIEKASGFRLRQKTVLLNFCTPCRIFKHFPSTDYKNAY